MFRFFVLFSFFLYFNVLGFASSNKSEFEQRYSDILKAYQESDLLSAISEAEKLYNSSDNDLEKVRSLMLLSLLHNAEGELSLSFDKVFEAEEYALSSGNREWIMRVKGMISDRLMNLGLYEKGYQYLLEIEQINRREKNELIHYYILQNKVFYFLKINQNSKAIEQFELLKASSEFISKYPEKSQMLIMTYLLEGMIEMQKHLYVEALNAFKKSEELLIYNQEFAPFVYVNLIKCYLQLEDYNEAWNYLLLMPNHITLHVPEIMIDYLDLKQQYFNKINDYEAASYYQQLYEGKKIAHLEFLKKITNEVIPLHDISSKNKDNKLRVISLILILLIFILISIGVYSHFVHKRIHFRNKKLLYFYRGKLNEVMNNKKIVPSIASKEQEAPHLLVPPDLVEKILNGLKEFEATSIYLNNDCSLSQLSAYLNCNTKYLSHVLNNYKNQDFNTYINELRIKYIVEKINTDPQYLNYKISYLADEAGFSSHSRFSQVFKNFTGFSPSVFIKHKVKEQKFKT